MLDQILKNIVSTQQFLAQTLSKSNAKPNLICRSIPPEFENKLIYDKTQLHVDWLLEEYCDSFEGLERICHYAMRQKEIINQKVFEDIKVEPGRLFAFYYNETLWCGGSQQCSEGFVDNFNAPPIDTWIWVDRKQILAWIPNSVAQFADDGISSNPEACINWLEESDPELNTKILNQLVSSE